MHAEWTIRAAQHGKHVLCEKPLAANAAEAREMAAACREHHVQLMDGVMWVHHDRTRVMREHLDSGVLGQFRRVTAAFSFNWDQVPTDNIRLKPELAGGSLGDLGYYCVRAIGWALQEIPRRVFATARYYNGVDLNMSGLLWFGGDRVASFDCGFDTVYRKWFELAGTRGSLVCDDFVVPWEETKGRFWLHDSDGKGATHVVENCVQEVRMIEHFGDIVRSGQLDDRWPSDAITTMRICDALAESARLNRIVEFDRT
jgi:predicted dehydrogenase